MHPNSMFCWKDEAAVRAFIADIGFAAIFAATPDALRVAQVPVVWTDEGRLRFHLARGNALVRHLDGLRVLALVSGPDAYVSPDWYGTADQVPTWNYISAEIEGRCRMLDEDELVSQLDLLSAGREARLPGKTPWTRAKMTSGRFEAMLKGIVGAEIEVMDMRATAKLGQNKTAAERCAAADGLAAVGNAPVAHLMRTWHA